MEELKPPPEVLERWLAKQRERDPELYRRLTLKARKLSEMPEILTEAAAAGGPQTEAVPLEPALLLETIVRDGRPAVFIRDTKISTDGTYFDDASKPIMDRLEEHRSTVEKMIPLVGRIDIANDPAGRSFLGTGWLVAEDVIITNRHVAQLLARRGAERYEFIPGRFGDPVSAQVGFGHEVDRDAAPAVRVSEVLYSEPPGNGPDLAFIRVDRRTDGLDPPFIKLAETDPAPGDDVVVIGYPARAPSSAIPDQEWMERLYGRIYDVKRAAPGKIDDPNRGWTTHDCTTLGGNSGSVVLNMATGTAAALHFAGLYMVENYAVPASILRTHLGNRPWPYRLQEGATGGGDGVGGGASGGSGQGGNIVPAAPGASPGAYRVTVPLTVTLSFDGAVQVAASPGPASAEEAAQSLETQVRGGGVLAVRPGLFVEDGAMRDEPVLVVAAAPERLNEVRTRLPDRFSGLPVQVRPASLEDQLGLAEEAPRGIAYDDANRQGPDFRSAWINEDMVLRLHVGPDRSFAELGPFLESATDELVSAIYQFFADHIRASVDKAVSGNGVRMTLVADPQTRDHDDAPPQGQFDRSDAFTAWGEGGSFRNIYVPEGNGGLVDNAYHIKVTVKDGEHVWLSSGNWTRTSQPRITGDPNDARAVSKAGNREWHVIAKSPAIARFYKAHIEQDFTRCGELGGQPESLDPTILVDVPEALEEAIELEAPADRLFEPLEIDGKFKVKPLLTPDGEGALYCDAVLDLIASAQQQLLFQNQYIKVSKGSAGRFGALVDALARAAQRVPDCRIILRSDGTGFWDNVAELKRRGIDVTRQVRRLAGTHTKGIVVDGRRVLVGSHNWSQSGVTLNRDASLIIDHRDAADYFRQVFEVDWARASPLTLPAPTHEAVRIATGEAPPPGYRRMPISQLLEG